MPRYHLVRVGVFGQIGRFAATDTTLFPRGSQVIVRTERGLETGEVLAPPVAESAAAADGSLLRGMTVEDQLLLARLSRQRQTAYEACRRKMQELRLKAELVDVEALFDGRTLVFYFLGQQPPELASVTSDLAAAYDSVAQIGAFGEVLTNGCGPGCGTEQAAGHGCTNCSTGCAVAGLCSTGKS